MTTKSTKPLLSSRVQRKANLLVLACAAALMAAVAGTVWQSPAAAAGALSVMRMGVIRLRSQEAEDILQLIISDGGFEPAQVTRGTGKFQLTADDHRSDKSRRLKLRLSREGGEPLRDIEVPGDAVAWAEEVDLQAGRYTLTVVDSPEWVCHIIINNDTGSL
jgi:hypothetical protein